MREGVIHFSTSDTGGAGTGAYRIHQSILRLGVESILFVQNKSRNDESVIQIGLKPSTTIFSRILNKIRRFNKSKNRYNFYDRMVYTLTDSVDVINKLEFKPKYIFIHWVSGFLDTDLIVDLKREFGSTVYLTFMDVAHLTGGCHYSWDCLGYLNDCSGCPAVGLLYKNLPKNNLSKKLDFVKCVSAIPVSSNSWINTKISASRIFNGAQIKPFNLGIDSDIFCPGSKKDARDQLRVPVDRRYILVGASSLDDSRKGIEFAKKSIVHLVKQQNCNLEGVEVLIAGSRGKFDVNSDWGLPARYLGQMKCDQELVNLYRASDIFLSTSIEDAGPMMVSEAMLCGLPVASFEVGSAIDLIISSKVGFLAPVKDYKSLANSLSHFLSLDPFSVKSLSDNSRQIALNFISLHAEEKNLLLLLEGHLLKNSQNG